MATMKSTPSRYRQVSLLTPLLVFMATCARAGDADFSDGAVAVINGFTLNMGVTNLMVGHNLPETTLVITNGGMVGDAIGYLGYHESSSNNLTIVTGNGSVWNNRNALSVGNGGSFNTLLLTNGGIVNNPEGVIGFQTGAKHNQVIISGAGSQWHNRGGLYLGFNGAFSTLLLTSGGTASAAVQMNIGVYPGSTNNLLTLDGGRLRVANVAGDAVLEVRRGIAVLNDGLIEADRLLMTNSTGFFTFNGGTLRTRGGLINNGQKFVVGNHAGFPAATWEVGGNASPTTVKGEIITGFDAANASLLVTNGGTLSSDVGSLGYSAGATNNQIIVSGPTSVWNNSSSLFLGAYGGFNTLRIMSGGAVSNGYTSLGYTTDGNQAIVDGAGSLWNNTGDLRVGEYGSFNTLLITNGGTVRNGYGYLGDNAGANNNRAFISGAGSAWINSSELRVGYNGSFNKLLITNGGSVSDSYGNIGATPGSSTNQAIVTGTGSVWNNSSTLRIGQHGRFNSVTISGGGIVNDVEGLIGVDATGDHNTCMVNGAGSVWKNGDRLFVGYNGALNTLLLTNGGTATAVNGVVLGNNATSTNNRLIVASGTLCATNVSHNASLDIRRGTNVLNAGLIEVDQLVMGNTPGFFEFNGGTLAARSTIVNNGTIFTVGDGTSAAIYHLAGNGAHAFNNGLKIASHAMLTGNGTINGTLAVAAGGTLLPGSAVGKIVLMNPPDLNGTILMKIGRSGATLTNSQVRLSTGTLTYGGVLTVTNLCSDELSRGDRFVLFTATRYHGAFSTINLPPLERGLTWTNMLRVDGSIEVISQSPQVQLNQATSHTAKGAALKPQLNELNPPTSK